MRYVGIFMAVVLPLVGCGSAHTPSAAHGHTAPAPRERTAPPPEPPEPDGQSEGGLAALAPPATTSERARGYLSRAVIREVIQSASSSMRHCYESISLRGPEPWPDGRVMSSFIIGPDGRVEHAQITTAAIADPALHECMIGVIRDLRFPSPTGGGIVGVNYPWVFTHSGSERPSGSEPPSGSESPSGSEPPSGSESPSR